MTVLIIQGDCRTMLATLADQSVQCVVTSPPYFGLRDYGVDGQIGLEATPAAYVAEMVAVFREIWRVLRDDGTVWLNLGDCYAGSRAGPQGGAGMLADRSIAGQRVRRTAEGNHQARSGAKHKDLLGIPWRVAFALQDDGWWLRRDIIWSKPNPMPESITDRPATSHEYVFLLTKSGDPLFWTHRDGRGARTPPQPDYRWVHRVSAVEKSTAPAGWPEVGKQTWRRINLWTGADYFYDAEAIAEPSSPGTHERLSRKNLLAEVGSFRANGGSDRPMKAGGRKLAAAGSGIKNNGSMDAALAVMPATRNARSVWTITTAPFAGAHFATFPPRLAEVCILAGTSEKGCCAACGAPWARTITKGEPDEAHRAACGADAAGGYHGQSTKNHDAAGVQNASDVKRRILEGMREKTYGWQQTCSCEAATVPCTVLDPFGGAGTVGLVADRLGRSAVLIELKIEYAEMARRRMVDDAPLFAEVTG